MAAFYQIALLGGFRAQVGSRVVPADSWRHRRGADLVKLLALAPGHRLHRERILDGLWPDLSPEAGSANLRKAVHYARRALGSDDAVRTEGGMVSLWPAGSLEVDVDRFEAAADAAARDPGTAEAAVALYSGDLLPEDAYEPWAGEARDRLHRRYLIVLKAAGAWDRVVELDPLDEEAHRTLMRNHIDAGDRLAAMRQFERLREALREELGVSPDPQTVALYEEVLAMEGREPVTPEELSRAHLAAGLVALNRMDLEEAEREATEARTLAVDAGLGKELGEASGLLGMVAHMRGTWRDLFRQEFLEALEVPSLAEYVLDAHLCLAEYSLYRPEGHGNAEEFARNLLEAAETRGSVHGRALATLMLGETALLSGRLQDAERDLIQAVELHAQAGAQSGQAISIERLAEAATAGGRTDEAKRLLEQAHELALNSTLASHLLVRIHGANVQATADMDAVERAEKELIGREVCDPCSMGYLTASAIASARAGDLERALRYLGEAERVSGMWQGGAWQAAVWETRAEVRLAEGEPRQTAALLREAAEGFSQAGHPIAAERCRHAAEVADPGNGPGTPRP